MILIHFEEHAPKKKMFYDNIQQSKSANFFGKQFALEGVEFCCTLIGIWTNLTYFTIAPFSRKGEGNC